MKSPSPSPWVLIAGIGFLLPGLHAQQAPALAFGESGLSQPIPDNDPSGVARTFTASGLQVGIPYDLRVSLSVESTGAGAFNGDYYAYLMHESISGSDFRLAVLMNRVGSSVDSPNGYSDSGFRLTFSDSAPHDIHLYRVSSDRPCDRRVARDPKSDRIAPPPTRPGTGGCRAGPSR